MNTKNLNTKAVNFDEQETASPKTKVTSEASFQVPKKIKKAKDAFRTISEVADKLGVQQHVLRFWETKFSQVRPLKRGGGRRYYRPEDIALLERIHHLLYTEGYTIKGVQKLMKEKGKAQMLAPQPEMNDQTTQTKKKTSKEVKQGLSNEQRAAFEIMLAELKAMRAMIKV